MSAHILAIGTAVPGTRIEQRTVRDFFLAQPGVGRLASRLIRTAFDQSAIESRHSVIGGPGQWESEFVGPDGALIGASTGARNEVYRREAPSLFTKSARDALAQARRDPGDVTHVVTVSCTGFFAPDPSFLLAKHLGFRSSVQRIHIGFMGCAAAFPALRTAAQICAADPDALVLVVCAELCSIHIRASTDPEQIVASALFGDGAAAAVVAARPGSSSAQSTLELLEFSTAVTSEGESDMDWTIGDQGFEMRLTSRVPHIIGKEIAGVVGRMVAGPADPRRDFKAWAVHPGGRSVLDRAQSALDLPDVALEHSRAILRDFGNMSSATILFILQRLMQDPLLSDHAHVAALGFGPGLTVETATLVSHTNHDDSNSVAAASRDHAGET